MSCTGGRTTAEGKRRRDSLCWAVALAALLVLGIGCGLRDPRLGPGSEYAPVFRWAPGDASGTLRTAHYFKLMGQPEMALKELEEAHRLDPANLKVANVLAQYCDDLGLGARAQQVYQEALALDPDNPVLLNNLGFSYYLAGNCSQAEACLRKTLARQPNNQAARNNLGLVLCRQGRQEEARQLWQQAEGQAAAAQKLAEALAALGMAKETHYAQQVAPLPPEQLSRRDSPPGCPPEATPVTAAAKPQRSQLPVAAAPKKIAPSPSPAPAPIKLAAALEPKQNAPDSGARAIPASKPPMPRVAKAPPLAPKTTPNLGAQNRPVRPWRPRIERAAATPSAVAPRVSAPLAKSGEATPQRVAALEPVPKGAAGETAPAKSGVTRPAPITARELVETNIAVLNGNGIPHLAHETRSLLSLEGFNVVAIANYLDFGVDRTVIYYRPDAAHVATLLNNQFFPRAEIKPASQLAKNIDVKVILGHDFFPQQHAEAPRRDESKRL
jgi:tetratricopeptide (TPR) repeat protein